MHLHQVAAVLTLVAGAAHADWHYDPEIDPATGKMRWSAELQSANTVARRTSHPDGPGSLWVWQSPRAGTLVGVVVESGELSCDEKSGCQVLMQFDGGAPLPFSGRRLSEESADAVLLEPAAAFIDRARQARLFRVALPTKGAERWLEFEARAPLRWLVRE